MRTRIKVCGITSIDDAIAAIACGADAIGFVFVEDTPRFIEPEEAALIMDALPPFVTTVGVVRDLSVDQFCELEQRCPAHYFQLHGKEPVDVVKQCTPAIKAFKYEPATIESQLARWTKVEEVAALLIDGSDGGEGTSFDWSELAPKVEELEVPLIVAGGLGPDNAGDAIRALRPYGIDVSSGVESEPGIKDPDKIAALCDAVRRADLETYALD